MRLLASALAAVSLLVATATADAPDLRRLFPLERDVFIERDGLTRIPVPADVLAACRADLSDLRVLDRQEREVPYLVDAGPPPQSALAMLRTHPAEIVEVRRHEERPDAGPPIHSESYVFEKPPAGGPWDLVLDVDERRFVRVLEMARDGGGSAMSVSIFRLPELGAEKIRVPLPPLVGRFGVAIHGEEGSYLEPKFRFESAAAVAGARERMAVPLRETGRRRENGRTVIELERPRGVVPDILELATETRAFHRGVEVWDEAPGASPVLLARGRVFRVPGELPAEEREVVVQPARGERLRVDIDDGDSPTLAGLTVTAVVRQPVLVLTLEGAGAAPAARLLFGGARAHAPRYDLAAFMPTPDAPLTDGRAEAAARLYDPAQTALARLGDTRDNPLFDRTPALAFAMRPGASLDERAWTHRRALVVHPSPEGLTRLRLTVEDLALALPDLADVRVVDRQSRQWPYLLDRRPAKGWADVVVGAPTQRRSASTYELRPAVAPVAASALELDTDVQFFDRAAVVVGQRSDGTQVPLASGRLAKRGSGSVGIALRPDRVARLELTIEDGNDAPLAFRGARVSANEHDLYLVAPEGTYTLLVGNAAAKPPSYELERVRDVILAVGAGRGEPAALIVNPTYSVRARLATGEGLERTVPVVVLWIVLIAAVLVLTGVTLRLARRGEAG